MSGGWRTGVACLALAICIAGQGLSQERGTPLVESGVPVTVDLAALPAHLEPLFRQELGVPEAAEAVRVDEFALWRAAETVSHQTQLDEGDLLPALQFQNMISQEFKGQDRFKQTILNEDILHVLERHKPPTGSACAAAGLKQPDCKAQATAYLAFVAKLKAAAASCSHLTVKNYRREADRAKAGLPANLDAFRAFDDGCLFSPTPWISAGGVLRRDLSPPVFRQAADPDGAAGALGAIALIQYRSGTGEWAHLCGGLLLRPATPRGAVRVLTALHCFAQDQVREALEAPGDPRIRVVRGTGELVSWTPGWTPDVRRRIRHVGDDYVVLDLPEAPRDLSIPSVRFEAPANYQSVVAVGYFIHHDAERVDPGSRDVAGASRVPSWRRGLRWSPVCAAIGAGAGCVRFLCQTERGFSGTPVFREDPDEDGTLVVNGIVSHAAGAAPMCFAPQLIDASSLTATLATLPVDLLP